MIDFSTLVQGLLACASLPFMWVPEHRCLVLMAEPLWHHVGPKSISLTIDVDTSKDRRAPLLAVTGLAVRTTLPVPFHVVVDARR